MQRVSRFLLPKPVVARRFLASGATSSVSTRHPEAFLDVARRWPHEEFAAESYIDASTAVEHPPSSLVFPSEHPNGEETHAYRATLANRFVTSLMAIGLTGVVVWRLNEAYGLKETFGEFIGGYLAAHSASILPNDARVIALNQELANERLLFTENNFHRKPVHRISFPGIFERASDRLVSPGTQANLDGLVIKHTWQRNSDLDEAIKKLQEN